MCGHCKYSNPHRFTLEDAQKHIYKEDPQFKGTCCVDAFPIFFGGEIVSSYILFKIV